MFEIQDYIISLYRLPHKLQLYLSLARLFILFVLYRNLDLVKEPDTPGLLSLDGEYIILAVVLGLGLWRSQLLCLDDALDSESALVSIEPFWIETTYFGTKTTKPFEKIFMMNPSSTLVLPFKAWPT